MEREKLQISIVQDPAASGRSSGLVCVCAMEWGLQLPWRKHYSVLDFLTSGAFSATDSHARDEFFLKDWPASQA
jgi:hypothetical protein